MGLTKNDIEMLRAEIPAQYRAGEGNASMGRLLRQDFVRADDGGDAGLGMDNLHADKNDIAATVAQPNRDIVAERMETERQIQREIMNGDGAISSIAVQAQKDSGLTVRAEAEKRKEKGGIDITTQLILLDQQIADLDRLIDDLQDQIAKLDANIDALQQALDSGDFSGAAAQKAINDYNKAHPDNPVDPNDPDAARNAVEWAQRKDQDRRDDLQTRLDDTRAQRTAKAQERENLARDQARELTDAAVDGQDALNHAADDLVATKGNMDVDITRAQITDRVVLESMDRAQGFDTNTLSDLSSLRVQQAGRSQGLEPQQSTLSLSGMPDLNAMPLPSDTAMDGGARTTSVADNLDGERDGPEIKQEFAKVSAMKDITLPDLNGDIDLNKTADLTGGPAPGSNFG